MARKRRWTQRYYNKMEREHGHAMFCPVCDARPCIDGCTLGIQDERELARMSNLLRPLDGREGNSRRKKRR